MTKANSDAVDALRYPIGRFVVPEKISAADRAKYLEEIAAAPAAGRFGRWCIMWRTAI